MNVKFTSLMNKHKQTNNKTKSEYFTDIKPLFSQCIIFVKTKDIAKIQMRDKIINRLIIEQYFYIKCLIPPYQPLALHYVLF